jgi:hypothetical protein
MPPSILSNDSSPAHSVSQTATTKVAAPHGKQQRNGSRQKRPVTNNNSTPLTSRAVNREQKPPFTTSIAGAEQPSSSANNENENAESNSLSLFNNNNTNTNSNSSMMMQSPMGYGGGMMGGGMMGMYGGGGMMSPMMMGGPFSGLYQTLFGIQNVVFSLGQAVQMLTTNQQALQQILDSGWHMLDNAVATFHELQALEALEKEQETEEEKKRRRRLKAMRWALMMGASWFAYKLIRRISTSSRRRRLQYNNSTGGGDGGNIMPASNYNYGANNSGYGGYGSSMYGQSMHGGYSSGSPYGGSPYYGAGAGGGYF